MRGRDISFEKLDEKEKGYLFGLFEGDGYSVHDKKSRHYHIEFYLNSEKDGDIIKYLVFLLSKIGLVPNLYKDKRFNCMRIRVYSKKLFGIISKNISIKNKCNNFCIGYVSGMIDSEGHVSNKKHYIMIVNTNEKALKNCGLFLNKKGVNYSISKRKPSSKDKLDSYRMFISVSFKSLNHLSIKAGKLK